MCCNQNGRFVRSMLHQIDDSSNHQFHFTMLPNPIDRSSINLIRITPCHSIKQSSQSGCFHLNFSRPIVSIQLIRSILLLYHKGNGLLLQILYSFILTLVVFYSHLLVVSVKSVKSVRSVDTADVVTLLIMTLVRFHSLLLVI